MTVARCLLTLTLIFTALPAAMAQQEPKVVAPNEAPEEKPPTSPGAIEAAKATLRVKPIDCIAVQGAFERAAAGGRQEGDIELVVEARRSDVPCVNQAAESYVATAGVPRDEVVAWVLGHPSQPLSDASAILDMPPEGTVEEPPEPEAVRPTSERRLDCGIVLVEQRMVRVLDSVNLLLTFRNDTERTIAGHDIVAVVTGRPRLTRTSNVPGAADSYIPAVDRPIGEQLAWDPTTQDWEDTRITHGKSATFTIGPTRQELHSDPILSILPGQTFEVAVSAGAWSPDLRPERLDVTFESCKLSFR